MNKLNREMEELLKKNGADLVGFADLRDVSEDWPYGVVVAMAIDPGILESLENGPSPAYNEEYIRLNAHLDSLVTAGADFLKTRGYKAVARTRDSVPVSDEYTTELPYKSVALRAGLGWIGKSNLFISREYGPGFRMSTLLTDAEFDCGTPYDKSYCGDCNNCVDICPADALTGRTWTPGMDRELLYDPYKCSDMARELSEQGIGERLTLCGKCIVVCPYSKRT